MSDVKKVVIIGGVAGGASCAARARRVDEDAEIILIERGPDVSFANCGLPYHISGAIPKRESLLVQTPTSLHSRFNMDVRVHTEALRIDRANKQVLLKDLKTGREYAESYDALVLSPGAEPIRPALPGANSARVRTLRNLADMDAIQQILSTFDSEDAATASEMSAAPVHKSAVVIGGGYIGLEMTEALVERGVEVTLVELAHQVMGPVDAEMATPLHNELKRHGVTLKLGMSANAFEETLNGLNVTLSTGEVIACGLAILAIGVKPDVRLAREAGLELGAFGGIAVSDQMQTSDPDIYAVGDAIETHEPITGTPALLPLAGPANRQGRIAADAIFGRDTKWRGTQGTAICKIFGLAIGITGLSEKAAVRLKRPYEKVYVHPASHASYYPGASPISFKLLFDPQNGKVLGAQAVGMDGIDKRMDVIAMALQSGMTVFDLEEAELSYAPPYGAAKDVINYAGFVAGNALRGDVKLCQVADMLNPQPNQALLDVSTPVEFGAGTVPGAINIPLDTLRARLGELSHDKEFLVFCQVGLRGYLACRILSQHGFACRNQTGGYKTYLMCQR
jgi:NADPH-dependent 2,4-dienoyl-CoA reductase/sulfur reductase-like enzyme/rhodanese-related sulfurtransferase